MAVFVLFLLQMVSTYTKSPWTDYIRVLKRSCSLCAEGNAFLIVAPDSNVLMTRTANLLRFNELLDKVGRNLVEGQDSLEFTAKVLFPFTVTQELDRMKDPRSGQPLFMYQLLYCFTLIQRTRT